MEEDRSHYLGAQDRVADRGWPVGAPSFSISRVQATLLWGRAANQPGCFFGVVVEPVPMRRRR